MADEAKKKERRPAPEHIKVKVPPELAAEVRAASDVTPLSERQIRRWIAQDLTDLLRKRWVGKIGPLLVEEFSKRLEPVNGEEDDHAEPYA